MNDCVVIDRIVTDRIVTDLHLGGISMNFAGRARPIREKATVSSSDGYYDHTEAFVSLRDGGKLHILLTSSGEMKVTFFDQKGDRGVELGWVSAVEMKRATRSKLLCVGGHVLKLAQIPRSMYRVIKKANL